MNSAMTKFIIFVLLASYSLRTYAVCEGHPSVEMEFGKSDYVIVATVRSFRHVKDPEDPEGYAATIYRVGIDRVLRGAPSASIDIYSVNTSSRFPMDIGKKYLLFVYKSRDGKEVDACGNSELLEKRKNVLLKVLALSRKK